MLVVHSDAHRAHDPPIQVEAGVRDPMQETPERIDVIVDALRPDGRFEFVVPAVHGRSPIDAVHDPAMVDFLAGAFEAWSGAAGHDVAIPDVFFHPGLRERMGEAPRPRSPLGALGYWCFETTTPMVAGTNDAARVAVDVALTAGDLVVNGARSAYALCRPPGHHAARAVFGGYCFFNNAAILAHDLSTRGLTKIAVLDVDYHHGNGTQQIFYERADVFYASLHGDPERAYPYFVGYSEETGSGPGRGTNLNIPLPAGCDDDRYLRELDEALDRIDRFGAEVLVVSLGLDLFAGDPLGDFAVTTDGIARVGRAVAARSLPTIVVQEGGYAIADLGKNALAFVDAFADGEAVQR